MKRISKFGAIGLCLVLAASCSDKKYNLFDPHKHDLIDPDSNYSRDDYRNMYDPTPVAAAENGEAVKVAIAPAGPPIPELADILVAPQPPKIGETQPVSVAVTDDVPVKDLLIELARQLNIDIEVDANITGGIAFIAKDRPFNEVVERIADLAGLRYSMKNNVLRVERDTPYIQVYSLNLLNIERTSNSNISVGASRDISASSGSGGGGGGGSGSGPGGSSSTITGKTESDFWKQFEASVGQILNYRPAQHTSDTSISSQPAPAEAEPAPAPAAAPSAPVGGRGRASAAATPAAASGGGASGGNMGGGEKPSYVINREAGTLTVSANQRQHEMIRNFIKKIEANASAEVLIEAKILEVTLDDEYHAGINWGELGGSTIGLGGPALNFPVQTPSVANIVSLPTIFGGDASNTATNNVASFFVNKHIAGLTIEAAAKLVETFGVTHTLSNPRLNALNNQQAVLSFAVNQPYFTLQSTVTPSQVSGTTTTPPLATVNSTLHTVPIGLILTLQPSIDTENNQIILSVRPTLSRITGEVSDPAVTIAAQQAGVSNLVSNVPIVEVREMDSILKIKSGSTMIIGGLMQDANANTDSGVPGVASIPYLGNLFKSVDKSHNLTELVILIHATIVGGSPSDADKADQTLYNKFIHDPRPINFEK